MPACEARRTLRRGIPHRGVVQSARASHPARRRVRRQPAPRLAAPGQRCRPCSSTSRRRSRSCSRTRRRSPAHRAPMPACTRADRSRAFAPSGRSRCTASAAGSTRCCPTTIAIRDATEVPEDFHPRFSATGKHYRYTILSRADRSPRWRDRAWHHPEPLDVARDARRGRARCSASTTSPRFARPGARPRPRCGASIRSTFTRLEPTCSRSTSAGNAFLRNMVRILVGTLTEVGTGQRPGRASGRDPCLEGPDAGRHHRAGPGPGADRGPLRRHRASAPCVRCRRDSR